MLRIRTITQTGNSDTYLSTFYFGSTSLSDAPTAASSVLAFWTGCKSRISSSMSISLDPLALLVDPATGKPTDAAGVSGTPVTGTATGDVLPYATQGLLHLPTGVYVNGRQLQGRLFIPGPCEVDSSAGFPLSAYQSTIDSAATTLVTGTLMWGIYSRTHKQFKGIVSPRTWNNWGILRSRRDH